MTSSDPRRQRLEDPHIDVVLDAPVEDRARRRIGAGHLLEVALADERVGILAPDQVQQFGARARKNIAHKRDVILLGDIVLAVDLRVASQRQPGRRCDSRAAQLVGPVTLGGEDQVKALCLLPRPGKVEMGVDGPPGAGAQVRRQVIAQAVVDIQIKVEALAGNAFELTGLEMLTSTSLSARRQ